LLIQRCLLHGQERRDARQRARLARQVTNRVSRWILFASSSIPTVSYSVFHPFRRVCFQLADIKFRSARLHRSFSPSNAYVTENSPSVVFDPLGTPMSGLKRHSRSCTRVVSAKSPDLMSERTRERIFFQLPGLGNVKKNSSLPKLLIEHFCRSNNTVQRNFANCQV